MPVGAGFKGWGFGLSADRCPGGWGPRRLGFDSVSEIPYFRQATEFSKPARYAYGLDSVIHPGVPTGCIVEHEWTGSLVFPGTRHRCWVYTPSQLGSVSQVASLMVFQDGWMYLDPEGEIRAGIVFDNLIHRGEMPPTIGVFVDPGQPDNRNVEYDAFDDRYATFLLTEILPPVLDDHPIADDPNQSAICGGSSGGSCAFTVTWTRLDRFRAVISFLGSFAQQEGGNAYPQLIRQMPKKPIRAFLQAATRDLGWNEPEFNWLSANLQVAAALAERGYDLRFVLGDGGHDANHGGAILPDALRWLWRPR
jgi:enterochelin esterase-like enzyme